LKSRADFIPEKTDKKLDLHQDTDFRGALIFRQMKAKLTTKIAQHFAKVAESVASNACQVTAIRKQL